MNFRGEFHFAWSSVSFFVKAHISSHQAPKFTFSSIFAFLKFGIS